MSLEGRHNTWLATTPPAKGVVLLTHGLNGSPACLDSLGRALARSSFEVFRPSFSGHRGNNEEFLAVTPAQWEQDARDFHAQAKARADSLGVPLHLCAYSMSALIFSALPELKFGRRIFFAPALTLHFWYPAAMGVVHLFPWVKFRSRIPEGYSANPRSGFRSAVALHAFRKRWRGEADSVPTLIWADRKDELVNAHRLKRLADSSAAWKYCELSTEGCTLPRRYDHLIIDEAALGRTEWERVTRETAEFLLAL